MPFLTTAPLLRAAIACLILGVSATAGAHPHDDDDDDDGRDAAGDASEWYGRAMSRHQHGDYDGAIAGFEHALAAGYEVDKTSYNIACGHARKGNRDAAFQWLQRAQDAGFELGDYLSSDDDLDSLRGDPRLSALAKADYATREKRYPREAERARERYQRVVERNPKRPDRFDEVGKKLLETGQYRLAGDAFVAAAARGEAESGSYYNAACARAIEGRTAEGLELLRKAIETGYTDAEHIDRDLDLDNLRAAPEFARLRQMAADLSIKPDTRELKQRLKEAGRKGWRGFHFDSESPELYRPLLPKAEAATSKYPTLGVAWFHRGFVELRAGEPRSAVASYRRAIELGFRKKTSLYNLACAQAASGNKDAAFEALNAAVDAGFTGRGLVRQDDDLDSLRDDPRYQSVLDRLREFDRDWRDHD